MKRKSILAIGIVATFLLSSFTVIGAREETKEVVDKNTTPTTDIHRIDVNVIGYYERLDEKHANVSIHIDGPTEVKGKGNDLVVIVAHFDIKIKWKWWLPDPTRYAGYMAIVDATMRARYFYVPLPREEKFTLKWVNRIPVFGQVSAFVVLIIGDEAGNGDSQSLAIKLHSIDSKDTNPSNTPEDKKQTNNQPNQTNQPQEVKKVDKQIKSFKKVVSIFKKISTVNRVYNHASSKLLKEMLTRKAFS